MLTAVVVMLDVNGQRTAPEVVSEAIAEGSGGFFGEWVKAKPGFLFLVAMIVVSIGCARC